MHLHAWLANYYLEVVGADFAAGFQSLIALQHSFHCEKKSDFYILNLASQKTMSNATSASYRSTTTGILLLHRGPFWMAIPLHSTVH